MESLWHIKRSVNVTNLRNNRNLDRSKRPALPVDLLSNDLLAFRSTVEET